MPDQDRELNPIEKVVDKLGQVPKLALFVNISADIGPTVTWMKTLKLHAVQIHRILRMKKNCVVLKIW